MLSVLLPHVEVGRPIIGLEPGTYRIELMSNADLLIKMIEKNEIVVYSNIPGGFNAGKIYFEEMLNKSFRKSKKTNI